MQIGEYRIIDRLGIGGSGEIYRAHHQSTEPQEIVVIKRLLAKLRSDALARDQFLIEADLGRRLMHPNLIRQLAFGLEDEELFLVLQDIYIGY